MGRKTRDVKGPNNPTSFSPSVREALLFTTMSIIGLPVEVQVKDGSIYSGIFHTACFEKEYGIVLKKAKMTKKGKKDANLANGDVVETLVVHSGDLVQVVAKGHSLPADGIVGSVPNEYVEAVNGSVQEHSDIEMKLLKSRKDAPEVLEAEKNQISQIRGSEHNENKVDHGVTNNNTGVDNASNVEKGHRKEVAQKFLGITVETGNGKEDSIHSAKVDEASTGPVGSVKERQVGKEKAQKKGSDRKSGDHKDDTIHEFHYSNLGENANIPQLKSVNGVHVDISLRISSNGPAFSSHAPSLVKQDTHDYERPPSVNSSPLELCASDLSSSLTTTVNLSSQTIPSASQTASIARKEVSNTSSKEFKLNPGAKTFLPMFSVPKSATPPVATAVESIMFVPNNTPPVLPVAIASPEVGISSLAPRSSLPAKFVPYNNLVAINGDSTSQYSQPVVGHVGSRPQPIRYANQYNPIQAGPTYVHPNSQPVMVSLGRLGGQLVYMHPVSHDAFQSSTIPSQVPVRPQLSTQVHVPKHQGSATAQALQMCVTQAPFVATGQQPFALASQVPFSQAAFPVVRPVQVPGVNAHFGNKFY